MMKKDDSNSGEIIFTEARVEEYVCPACGAVTNYRCRLCGATRTTNQVSGNVIWMKNGRILEAFDDELQAWSRMAEKYGIPIEAWPEKFRNVIIPKIDVFEE